MQVLPRCIIMSSRLCGYLLLGVVTVGAVTGQIFTETITYCKKLEVIITVLFVNRKKTVIACCEQKVELKLYERGLAQFQIENITKSRPQPWQLTSSTIAITGGAYMVPC